MVPVIVIDVPAVAAVGVKLVIVGTKIPAVTVKLLLVVNEPAGEVT